MSTDDREERIEYLERRVAFLEATLARFIALVLHSGPRGGGKTKQKDRAATVGAREVLEKGLDAALIDLTERADLTTTERLAMPDPEYLRRRDED